MIIIDDFHSTKRSKSDGGPDDGEAPVIVSLVEAAMQMFSASIDALPDTNDPEFSGRANVILSGLRKLQSALTKAASRGRATPSVIVSLSGVRTRYDDLMALAAEAPGATLGQQLYVVRRRAKLSALETANGAGSRPICSTPSRPRKSRPTTKRPGSRSSSRLLGADIRRGASPLRDQP